MKTSMRLKILEVLDAVLHGGNIDYADTTKLSCVSGGDLWDLFTAAGRIRDHYQGRNVDLCSIINAKSGSCSENCSYCAQSSHYNTGAPVFPLISLDRITDAAKSAKKNGAKRFCIVTSGRGIDSHEDIESIAQGIGCVQDAGLSPCATLGTLTKDQLAYLKEAGLHRYHHNIETSREYFPRICTTHAFDERLEVLSYVKDLGLSPCSGGILGMGESMEDRIRMAFILKEMNVDSVPINFLMPIKGTPLEHIEPILPLEALHSIALFRFILPDKEIRVCGGRGSALGQLHPLILAAGANGFMIGNYLTTSGLDPQEDLKMVHNMGFTI
jgi:biotin synthase